MRQAVRRVSSTAVSAIVAIAMTVGSAQAAGVLLRWRPVNESGIAGYYVYHRLPRTTYGTPVDAGLPALQPDGTRTFTIASLPTSAARYFAVSAYKRDGLETDISNEVVLGGPEACVLDRCDTPDLCVVDVLPDLTPCNGGVVAPCGAACLEGECRATQLVCDDHDVCTTDSCGAGGCVHVPVAGCESCSDDGCDDGNGCTNDACGPTGCTHTPIPGCRSCQRSGDCNDGKTCTADSCSAGRCLYAPISGCVTCTTEAQCNDGNVCTADVCTGGRCTHRPITGCASCTSSTSCHDANGCTIDTCTGGRCTYSAVAGCTPCISSGQCEDGNGCTTDVCSLGRCTFPTIPTCVNCVRNEQCADADVCTADLCTGGACVHQVLNSCDPCRTHLDCIPPNACSVGACSAGRCVQTPIAECRPCFVAGDCDDSNQCTVEQCSGGRCQYSQVTACATCNENTDCNDEDPCTTDRCAGGDCVYEVQPGCRACAQDGECDDASNCTVDACTAEGRCRNVPVAGSESLAVRRLKVVARTRGVRMTLSGKLLPPRRLDPQSSGVLLVITDAAGTPVLTAPMGPSTLLRNPRGTAVSYKKPESDTSPHGVFRMRLRSVRGAWSVQARAVLPKLPRTLEMPLRVFLAFADDCTSDARVDCVYSPGEAIFCE